MLQRARNVARLGERFPDLRQERGAVAAACEHERRRRRDAAAPGGRPRSWTAKARRPTSSDTSIDMRSNSVRLERRKTRVAERGGRGVARARRRRAGAARSSEPMQPRSSPRAPERDERGAQARASHRHRGACAKAAIPSSAPIAERAIASRARPRPGCHERLACRLRRAPVR